MWVLVVALPSAFLGLALFDLPYGFYTFLRLVITIAAFWLARLIYQGRLSPAIVVLVLTAILYNPIVKVHMSREVHAVFNVMTIILFVGIGWLYRRKIG
jgi:hypothetical protein